MPVACLDRLAHGHALPGRRELDLVLLIANSGAARHLFGGVGEHVLGQFHHAVIVDVGFVEFQHREFGVVLVADALVAEVAPDLVDRVVAADQQALEVQLEADAQVQILVKLVVVRDERARRRAAVDRLEDRRLHFQKGVIVEEVAQRADRLGALDEDLAHVAVDGEVGVALAVARFHVAELAELDHRAIVQRLLLDHGQRAERLAQQLERADAHADFARFGAHQRAARLHEIVHVDQLVLDGVVGGFVHVVDAQEQLQTRRLILDVQKRDLALDVDAADPTADGHSDGRPGGCVGVGVVRLVGFERGNRLRVGVRALDAGGISRYPLRLQIVQFFEVLLFELIGGLPHVKLLSLKLRMSKCRHR